jgi:hypothetical protein
LLLLTAVWNFALGCSSIPVKEQIEQVLLKVYTFYYLQGMKNLSLKMDEPVFQETERMISRLRKNRNRYINEAVQFYNMVQNRKLLSKQLQKESKLVRDESMKMLAEFESLENED